jgi:hypothetical protein
MAEGGENSGQERVGMAGEAMDRQGGGHSLNAIGTEALLFGPWG